MKLLVTYDYQYFTVYHVWAKENTFFKWAHAPTDGVGMGQASYYKGQLKTVDAFNPNVVGLIWRGHYNWSDREAVPEYWSRVGEWQKCVAFQGDIEWWCLHSAGDIPLRVRYVPLTGPLTVQPQTSVFVLEGQVRIDDDGRRLAAAGMQHLRPRPYAVTIDGDAKVWLIEKRSPAAATPQPRPIAEAAVAITPVSLPEPGRPPAIEPVRVPSSEPAAVVAERSTVTFETERRFLVVGPGWRTRVSGSMRIRQADIAVGASAAVRVQIVGERATLTMRAIGPADELFDFEYAIPMADADRLMTSAAAYGGIEKRRHRVVHGGRVWNVDEYQGGNAGLVLAEVEARGYVDRVAQPPWLGREVTRDARYRHSTLAAREHH